MARWRLTASHYINVPGTEWEYKEVDRKTGKQKTRKFPVPQLLNPDDPSDWNYRHNQDEGEIIVCHDGKGEPRDIVFLGDPTPDMIPLDAEAKELTAAMAPKWNRPFEKIEGNSYADDILDDLTKQVADVRASQTTGGMPKGLEELLTAMGAMMKQNQEIMTQLVESKTEPKLTRRA